MAPMSSRADDSVQGHWLLARLGKRVLRPGGVGLTRTMLAGAGVTDADVLELAPGLGRTAAEILARQPRSYVGAEQDPDAADTVRNVIAKAGSGSVRVADAADTGLPDASRDVVIGEAMLTMQGDATKHAIVAEAARVLRPGGRYAIHELALTPDTVSEEISTEIRQSLARAIKVNARPLTVAEWSGLLSEHGLVVDRVADRTDGAVAATSSDRRRRAFRGVALCQEPARQSRRAQAGADDAQNVPQASRATDRRRDHRP